MDGYSWPSPTTDTPWPTKTKPLPRELIHAVGVIVIVWNECEELQLDIIRSLAGFGVDGPHDFRVGERIFLPMPNRQRSNLLLGMLDELGPPPGPLRAIKAFQTQFDTCLENRNLIVHSTFGEEERFVYIENKKSYPKIQSRYLPDDAEFWEETIAEMKRLVRFGMDILNESIFHRHNPWPEIPPEPRKLSRILQTYVTERRPPQSSGA